MPDGMTPKCLGEIAYNQVMREVYLSVSQVAGMQGVSRQWIWIRLRRGDFPGAKRVGNGRGIWKIPKGEAPKVYGSILMPELYLSVKQAARMQSVSRSIIYNLLRQGAYPGAKKVGDHGGGWRIPRTDVTQALVTRARRAARRAARKRRMENPQN